MVRIEDVRRTPVRLSAAVVGGALVWLTVLAFTRTNPADLTVALLVVLAEVLAVAVLSGPVLAVAVALGSVVLVNWYLVPPYGTFEIASTDNVVALVVYVFVAAVAAALVEVGARARSRAQESNRQAGLLGEVVAPSQGDDAAMALERVRSGLGLDEVELTRAPDAGPREPVTVLARAGTATTAPVVLDVPLPDGYRLEGRGAAIFAPDPDFLASLGAAAVRAYESDRMQEEALRADDLAAIDRARTALLASVGHDLRTPLASVRVSIDALRDPGSQLSDADAAALLATISSSAERLDDLITNLLDMSRLQAGVILARPEPVALADVVEQTLAAFGSSRLAAAVPTSLPLVSADPALLERVLANLASNALRYSASDRPVRLRAWHDADMVVLEVADEGPGLAPEDAAEVFTPFHRVGAQADGGTGLGLAIVKGFAEAMSMTITLRNGHEGGLVATLVMPRWTSEGGRG